MDEQRKDSTVVIITREDMRSLIQNAIQQASRHVGRHGFILLYEEDEIVNDVMSSIPSVVDLT